MAASFTDARAATMASKEKRSIAVSIERTRRGIARASRVCITRSPSILPTPGTAAGKFEAPLSRVAALHRGLIHRESCGRRKLLNRDVRE